MLIASIRRCESAGHVRESPEWWGVVIDSVHGMSRGLGYRYALPSILWDDLESDLLMLLTQVDWSQDDKQINAWLTMRIHGVVTDIKRRWYQTRRMARVGGPIPQIVSFDDTLNGIFDRFLSLPNMTEEDIDMSNMLSRLPLPVSHWMRKRMAGQTWQQIARDANVSTNTCIRQCRTALTLLVEPAEVD